MASSRAARGANKTLLQLYPQLQQGIVQARRDILGHLPPPTGANARTGYSKIATKQLTEVYHDQYYMEPIDKIARQIEPGFLWDHEERRRVKLMQLRRRGKGPPKKGSGRKKKK